MRAESAGPVLLPSSYPVSPGRHTAPAQLFVPAVDEPQVDSEVGSGPIEAPTARGTGSRSSRRC